LVIIWLKRWPARPLIELALLPPSVGFGGGVGDGDGDGVGVGVALGDGEGLGAGEGLGDGELLAPPYDGEDDGLDEGLDVGQTSSKQSVAAIAGRIGATVMMQASAAVSTAERSRLRTIAFIVSARTASRWDHRPCRHRRSR
jgi:hypothetical protein